MLRGTQARCDGAVRCCAWSPSSTSTAFGAGRNVSIRAVGSGSAKGHVEWRAHDSLVLALAWSPRYRRTRFLFWFCLPFFLFADGLALMSVRGSEAFEARVLPPFVHRFTLSAPTRCFPHYWP